MQAAAPAWSAWGRTRASSFVTSTMTRVAGEASSDSTDRVERRDVPGPVEIEDERRGRVAHHRLDGGIGVAGPRDDLESRRALERRRSSGRAPASRRPPRCPTGVVLPARTRRSQPEDVASRIAPLWPLAG